MMSFQEFSDREHRNQRGLAAEEVEKRWQAYRKELLKERFDAQKGEAWCGLKP